MAPRFYIDEDAHQALAPNLRAVDSDATATREVGNKHLSDAQQLAYAAEQGRAIITCNARDFALLHEVLLLWANRFGLGTPVHRGILIIPNGSELPLPDATRVVTSFVRDMADELLDDRLFEWLHTGGWQERTPPFR